MNIQKLQEHSKAWSAFEQYRNKHSLILWEIIESTPFETRLRYLLADLQAWLDSEGIYADAYSNESKSCGFNSAVFENDGRPAGYVVLNVATRPEAFFAAIEKGMQIWESNHDSRNSNNQK